jgi:hypothetical protein
MKAVQVMHFLDSEPVMQSQKVLSQETQTQTQGPVEIDAQMLHLIGGGLPKGTWGPGEDATLVATGGETPLPKGTW